MNEGAGRSDRRQSATIIILYVYPPNRRLMMFPNIIDEYIARVCIPRRHCHPNTLRALIVCASDYIAEGETRGGE